MITKQCVSCGKDFEVDETKRNWQSKKLCSPECQRSHTNILAKKKYTPIQWPQEKVCIRCGKHFFVNEGGNMAQKYCDSNCQLSAKAEKKAAEVEARREAKICEYCKNAFVTGKYTAHKQRFCSLECRSKARNKQRYAIGADKSKARNAYKYDFKRIRPQVLERDGNKCVICGSTEKLHAHHWDNSGGSEQVNNALYNLGTVCDVCHYAIHNITLVKINGEWMLDSKIFSLLGLDGAIKIK